MWVIVAKSLFELQPNASIMIDGDTHVYPVNRVFCVGRNYEEHAAKMGNTIDRSAPFDFTKSPQSVIHGQTHIKYPTGTQNYHNEVEFVVIGTITPKENFGNIGPQKIELFVNDEPFQSANLSDMILAVPHIICDLSKYDTLHPGDVIMTGTPAGIGPVIPGDKMDARIDGILDLVVTVEA